MGMQNKGFSFRNRKNEFRSQQRIFIDIQNTVLRFQRNSLILNKLTYKGIKDACNRGRQTVTFQVHASCFLSWQNNEIIWVRYAMHF